MEQNRILIVGLGNPGDKYKNTRHNAGFIAIDELQKNSLLLTSAWKNVKHFNAEVSEGSYKKTRLYFLKPQTFMNLSGRSVALIAGFYKIPIENIVIIYDDKDIDFGKFRIREIGSSGGHNGIKSIIECLGSEDFIRFKIGIRNEHLENMDTSNFVLGRLDDKEFEELKNIAIHKITPAIFETIDQGVNSAQDKYSN